MAYLMIPLIQREILAFVDLWNSHRIRKQKGVVLPEGIPNHLYDRRLWTGELWYVPFQHCVSSHFTLF